MSKWFVVILIYAALALEAAAAPPPPTEMTPAGLQRLVQQYGELVEAKKAYNESVGKDEFVVEVSLQAPKDLLASKQALTFFLNSEDDRGRALASVQRNGSIAIRQDMSPILFLRGFTYEATDNAKGIRDDREKLVALAKEGKATGKKTESLATEQHSLRGVLYDKINNVNTKSRYAFYGIGFLLLVGVGFGYGVVQEIKKLKYVRSGQMDKDEHSKNRRVLVDQQRKDIKEQVSEKTDGFYRELNHKVSKATFQASEQDLKNRLQAVEFDNQEIKEVLSSVLNMGSVRVTEETAMFSRKQTEVNATVLDKAKNGKHAEAIETATPLAALPEATPKPTTNGHAAKEHFPVPNTEEPAEMPLPAAEPLTELPMELPEEVAEDGSGQLSNQVENVLDRMRRAPQPVVEAPRTISLSAEKDEGEPTIVKKAEAVLRSKK